MYADKIDKSKYYWALMQPLRSLGGLLFFRASLGNPMWVKCKIDESKYQVIHGYKVTLKPIDPHFAKEHYYQDDFLSQFPEYQVR